jgi:peptidoglycan/xylan/chitin deacetylase (PgdA/CDA1 family)
MRPPQSTELSARSEGRGRRRRARRRNAIRFGNTFIVVAVAILTAAASLLGAGSAIAAGAGAASQPGAAQVVDRPEPVPILVYHHVITFSGEPRLLCMTPAEFGAQLRWLRDHRYHPVTLGTVYDAWAGKGTLPSRPVVLSFDDGYVEQYTVAARMLARYHWPADLSLVVYRGTPLSNAMVARMIRAGWEIVSHTLHHPMLTRLSSARLRRELTASRRMLERSFHVPVRFFCYPYGVSDRRVADAVKRAGYEAALATRFGAALPKQMYALPRIYVYHGESLSTFGRRLRRTVATAAAGQTQPD